MTVGPILVLASGHRCGSTLLQRLLNSHPQVLIWGEQQGHVERFLAENRTLAAWATRHAEMRQQFLSDGYDQFLANMVPCTEEIQDAARTYLRRLFQIPARRLGRSIWGFKEVRYDASFALMFLEHFPDTRIVHLTRDVRDCYRSLKRWELAGRWEAEWTHLAVDDWVRINGSFLAGWPYPECLLRLRYEDMIANPDQTIAILAGFLGLDRDRLARTVFDRRLRDTPDAGSAACSEATPVEFEPCDLEILDREDVRAMARAYGYPPCSRQARVSPSPASTVLS